MKKLLLTTTVLAMGLGVSGAYAMTGAEISLSGSSKWSYKVVDDGDNEGGANDSSFAISNSVTVASSNTSDSGLTYGTSLTLDTSGGPVSDDGMKLFVKGPFGEIRTGTGTAGDSYGIDADGFVEGEESKVKGSTVGKGTDSSISYFTPSISGIEAAISYTDAGTESKADSSEFGVKFTTAIAGGDMAFQFAQANTSDNGSAGSASAKDTSFGVNFAFGDLTLRAASNKSEPDGGDEKDVVDFGLSYNLNSDVVLGLYNRDGEEGSTDLAETGISMTYTVAPGLSANVAYTTSEEGDDDTTATTAYIKVAF